MSAERLFWGILLAGMLALLSLHWEHRADADYDFSTGRPASALPWVNDSMGKP